MEGVTFWSKCSTCIIHKNDDIGFSSSSLEKCFIYMDDVIVLGFSENHHLRNLKEIFMTCKKHNLKSNPDKCEFFRTEVSLLGHKCTADGLFPDPKKLEVVRRYPRPKDGNAAKRFVAFANYYRRFISNFAEITRPLTNLTRKRVKFNWTQECESSFEKL